MIIGGGPAGSVVAACLARLGWRVRLFDRDAFPRHKVCGEFLSPELLDSLRRLEIAAEFTSLGAIPLDTFELSSASKSLEVRLPRQAFGLSRWKLDQCLLQEAVDSGVEFFPGAHVTRVEALKDDYQLEIRVGPGSQPQRYRARCIIFANGGHSLRVRNSTSSTKTYVGIKCHLRGLQPSSSVEMYLFKGGYAGLSPIEGNQMNLCFLMQSNGLLKSAAAPERFVQELAKQNKRLSNRISKADVMPESLKSTAALDFTRVATPWHMAPRLGDSARPIVPLCGDGIAMAVRSAELCLETTDLFLRERISRDTWQQSYAALWKREFGRRLRLGGILHDILVMPRRADWLLAIARILPGLPSYLIRSTRG